MFKKFQIECPVLYGSALAEAKRLNHAHLGVEHLALALLGDAASPLAAALKQNGFDIAVLIHSFDKEVGTGKSHAVSSDATPRLKAILALAAAQGQLTPQTLVCALLREGESLFARFLVAQGLVLQNLLRALEGAASGENSADATRLVGRFAQIPPKEIPKPLVPSATPNITAGVGARIAPKTAIPVTFPTPVLDKWGRDLSNLAEQGGLADAIGREREIEQMIMILARTQKANPILLGEAGVGKTAIVEALAWRIAQGVVPPILRGKRIVELQMGQLMSDTSLRGQFEERISQIVREASQAPDVILFIDEIHTIVGAGGGSGAQDAAQIMKPALARGEVDCIGATTQDEFNRFIRKDAALERRFSPVMISELTPQATLEILVMVASSIAKKQASAGYFLTISHEALAAAVALTDQYVKDRNQPDKSIDAIDMACARAVVRGHSTVSAADLAEIVSDWTGIPVGKLGEDDRQRFAQIEAVLEQRVVGQSAAITVVGRSVRSAMAGMKASNRPVGVFLFVGPSGVGKTKLAKELASFLFGSADSLIRFDMNEYQDKYTLSNLIGAPRGYIDSELGGAFTEALRRNPYSVVLLDEIEKAHPDILNVFLGVFDDGRISDNQGKVIDCSNAVFILTSNMGMGTPAATSAGTDDLRALAAQYMRPELVNRLTEIVRFEPLGSYELELVLDQVLNEKLSAFRTAQQLDVTVDWSAKFLMLSVKIDPQMGARPLERVVEQMLVQPLVDAVFAGQVKPGAITALEMGGRIVFTKTKEGV